MGLTENTGSFLKRPFKTKELSLQPTIGVKVVCWFSYRTRAEANWIS